MTGTLAELALAVAAFVVSHVALSAPSVRRPIVKAIGEGPFLAAYSVIAVALFAWTLRAYAGAPRIALWLAPTGIKHLSLSVMAVAAVFLVAGTTSANPSAVLLDRLARGREPAGIFRVTRHPVLWAVGLWASVHLAANGDAASAILFGSMGLLALAGTVLIDRKKGRTAGPEWEALCARTSNVPFAALLSGRATLAWRDIGWWRIAGGLVLYLVMLLGHEYLFGVAPLSLLETL